MSRMLESVAILARGAVWNRRKNTAQSTAPVREGRTPWPVALVIVAMSLWLLTYWYENAPIIPIWDGWFWVAQAKSFAEGGLSRLLQQDHPLVYNDHFYLVPSLIALVLGPLFDYSFRPFAFLCVISLILTGIAFYRLARAHGVQPVGALVAFLAVASFRHWENLLLGFQLGLPLCVLLGTVALMMADKRRSLAGFVVAFSVAVASVLSSSGGIAVLIVLILMRWFDPRRTRRWVLVGVATALLLLGIHYGLKAVYSVSFVDIALAKYSPRLWPESFIHALKLLGGGIAAGQAAVPLGLAVFAGTCALIVVQVRRTQRFDALCGLGLWGLLNALLIAVGRMPFDNPASRHEVFVAPAIGACAIGLVRLVDSLRGARLPVYVMLFAGLFWAAADNRIDARGYEQIISDSDIETRFALIAVASGAEVTPADLYKVYPYPPTYVRELLEFTAARNWMIFSGSVPQFEVREGLPDRTFGASRAEFVDGRLEFSGCGYLYNEIPSTSASGCVLEMYSEIEAIGTVTAGFILLNPEGAEYSNLNDVVPAKGLAVPVRVRAWVKPGSMARAYVYANGPDDRVKITSFSVRILQAGPGP